MGNDKENKTKAFLIILLGSLFTAILGFSFKRFSVFHPTDPGFQFITYGISGSILMAIIYLSNFKNFIIGSFSLLNNRRYFI